MSLRHCSDDEKQYFYQLQQPDLLVSVNSTPRERCDPDVVSCFGNLFAAHTITERTNEKHMQSYRLAVPRWPAATA